MVNLATEPTAALCDIEDPILFQLLKRAFVTLAEQEWHEIAGKLASLSPRSLLVALAVGSVPPSMSYQLDWTLLHMHKHKHSSATMREVRHLILSEDSDRPPLFQNGPEMFSSLFNFESLKSLHWTYEGTALPDDSFSLLRQSSLSLEHLFVSTFYFSPAMLRDIALMTTLQSLALQNDAFACVIPPLGSLKQLRFLRIHQTTYREEEPIVAVSTLVGLERLEGLVLLARPMDSVAESLPTLLPSLKSLTADPRDMSAIACGLLHSHYATRDGFDLKL